jgi:hypothetical protein
MKRALLLFVVLVVPLACGVDPCPPHSHQLDATTCECDLCFNDVDAGACLSEPEPGCGAATR